MDETTQLVGKLHYKKIKNNDDNKNENNGKINKKKKSEENSKDPVYGEEPPVPPMDVVMMMQEKVVKLRNFRPKPFDYSQIKKDSTVAMYGKRRTGKTFMCRWLWFQDNIRCEIPVYFVISPTAKMNKSWDGIIPEEYIHPYFEPFFIQRILERQDMYQTNPKMKHRNPWVGLMLDDVVGDSSIRYSDLLTQLFIAGRHYKMHLVVTTQYPTLITPKMRANLDYAFVFTQLSRAQRERICDDYMHFLDKDVALAILDFYTEDNGCLVIDLSQNSTDPEKTIFYTKAKEPPEYKLGCKEYWAVAAKKQYKVEEEKKKIQSDTKLMHDLDRQYFTLMDGIDDL